jgi:hypothetical protein
MFRSRATLIEQVPQDFRGHDNYLRLRHIFDVASHDSHAGLGELYGQVVEFLVGQGFDGASVEDSQTAL